MSLLSSGVLHLASTFNFKLATHFIQLAISSSVAIGAAARDARSHLRIAI
jgi:hypothetical protein